jgi:hypothetical protein
MLALAVFLLLLWLGLYFCMSKRVKAKVDYSYKIHIPSSSRHTTFAFLQLLSDMDCCFRESNWLLNLNIIL